MKFRAIRAALFLCVALALIAPTLFAQVTTAAMHGTVVDPAGAVIPDAEITALNTSTGISSRTKTDSSGYFKFNQLQIGGPYTVTVEAPGFSSYVAKEIRLSVNDDREVPARLTVGSTAQTVEVSVASAQVDTAETQLKTDILSDTITQMPLLGRDATTLQKSAPGVVEAADRFGGFSANGAQIEQNSYLLDGADVNDSAIQTEGLAVNPDAVGELAIVTSTINPEYSRNSGAIVNQALKTGTNSFHGNGFEFYRDTFLNTRSYFDPVGSKPPIHQHVYGGTLGGPIFRNKLFFFTAYQGAKSGLAVTAQTPVFSNAQRAGDFSADINSITDLPNAQSTGAGLNGLSGNPMPFALAGCAAGTPWNACPGLSTANVPTSSWNSIASSLFTKYVPAPNSGTLYSFANGGSTKSDQGIIRLDYHLTANDSLWSSVLFQSTPFSSDLPFGGSTLPGFAMTNAEHFKIFNADYTHIFNPHMINELRGGYFRFNYAAVEPAQIMQPSSAGFNITPQSAGAGLPVIAVLGYFNLGFSYEGPQPRLDSNLLGQDVFTLVHGNHSMKFGGTFEQFGVDNPYNADNDGIFNIDASGPFSSGDPAIDFAVGIPGTYTQTSGSQIAATSREYYAFAQDSWKMTPDFNMNYGISWDAETPWANHQFGGIAITCWQNSNAESKVFPGGPPGLLYPGDPGCTNYGSATVKWNHFGPRLGFVWSPGAGPSTLVGNSGGHALAIRAGFGMYFNRDQEEEALQNLSSPPFLFSSRGAADVGGSPSLADPFTDIAGRPGASITNPFPYQRPGPGASLDWADNYFALDLSQPGKNYLPSYSYNFNLNVQRAIGSKMVAQVGYVGSLGRKLARTYEGDPITPLGHAACIADAACRSVIAQLHLFYPQYTAQPAVTPSGFPWYLSVAQQGSTGASSYHSLQASLQQQVSHGLYFTLAYTYSHALDNSSGYESSYGNGTPNGIGSLNGRGVNFVPGFEHLNYGNSDYDARHRFVALYTYEIPVLASMRDKFIVNELLGKWHIAGTTALQTGFPVTISQSGSYRSGWCDAYTYYGCGDTPNLSNFHLKKMDPRNAATNHQYFDTSNFSPEPVGTFGNVGRNFFNGPGYNYTNLQVYKDIPLVKDGRVYLQVRLESYNVFNHANFAEPDGNFNDKQTFGTIQNVIQPANFGVSSGDPQPGRATQLSGKIYF
ncbi:TonB-dependent receptor [Occallatibacter savannae]|uniref:TonB-dependent receptor n=1 Tax=Occallatibacter savannae TaxID=1002691 RepID=UPI0013A58393|nr:carboxypeptidase-like regulatory domain-containing protein [Occallatibacter savannae]